MQQALNQSLLQHSYNNLAASPVALQQSCSNHLEGAGNLAASLQQALNQPLLQHSCNNFAASPVASLAATMQQSCNNYLEAWARAGGRAILQQTLNQAFLQHSYNNFAASSTIKQKHKNKSQNTLKIGPDPAKIGAKSTPGTLLGAHRTKSPIFCTSFSSQWSPKRAQRDLQNH